MDRVRDVAQQGRINAPERGLAVAHGDLLGQHDAPPHSDGAASPPN